MKIFEFETEVAEEFLQFIYTGQIQDEVENIMDLYCIAAKFKVQPLITHCESKIKESVNIENAFDILVIANSYESQVLKEKAFEMIKLKFPNANLNQELMNKPEDVKALINAREIYENVIKRINNV